MSFKATLAAIAVCSMLTVTGCQSTSMSGSSGSSGSYNNTQPDPSLTGEDRNLLESSYFQSCAMGAVIGGLGCLLVNPDNKAVCLATAAAGCGLFMGVNGVADKLRSDYASKEEQLDGLINYINEANTKAKLLAKAAKNDARENIATLKKIKKDLAAGKNKKLEAQKLIAQYDANIKLLQENINRHNQSLESFKYARNDLQQDGRLTKEDRKKIAECDKKIKELQKSIATLEEAMLTYTEDRNVLNLALVNAEKKGTKV